MTSMQFVTTSRFLEEIFLCDSVICQLLIIIFKVKYIQQKLFMDNKREHVLENICRNYRGRLFGDYVFARWTRFRSAHLIITLPLSTTADNAPPYLFSVFHELENYQRRKLKWNHCRQNNINKFRFLLAYSFYQFHPQLSIIPNQTCIRLIFLNLEVNKK